MTRSSRDADLRWVGAPRTVKFRLAGNILAWTHRKHVRAYGKTMPTLLSPPHPAAAYAVFERLAAFIQLEQQFLGVLAIRSSSR